MQSLFNQKQDCCGCSACVTVCPKGAVAMQQDEQGFFYPFIDQNRCIHCNQCHSVCPFKSENNTYSKPDIYAIKHKNENIRKNSSSGGVYAALSNYVLNQGGAVYGAVYDGHFTVKHSRAATKQERDRQISSKYVQSKMDHIFSAVKQDLTAGILVLFSGTPCQIAGLKNYLKKEYSNLILCDIICHGVPSPKIFEDYKIKQENKYHSKITSINFRGKQIAHSVQDMLITFQNGKKYSKTAYFDDYYMLFINNFTLRPSCFHCPFTSMERVGDITIGDFWGLSKSMPQFEDYLGVSLVLANSSKGKELLENCKQHFEMYASNAENCVQTPLLRPQAKPAQYEMFWKDYKTHGYTYCSKKYFKITVPYFVNYTVKLKLKQLFHK